MKPAWDQLGDEYESSGSVVIGDADCTAASSSWAGSWVRAEGGVDSGEELRAKICGLCGHLLSCGRLVTAHEPGWTARTGSRLMECGYCGSDRGPRIQLYYVLYVLYYIMYYIILCITGPWTRYEVAHGNVRHVHERPSRELPLDRDI